MKGPVVRGVIDRRIVLNYQLDPAVATRLLTGPFRPLLVRGTALASICIERLTGLRPSFLPSFLGVACENSTHQIGVEWTQDGRQREGAYVTRRDTSSHVNALLGGRLFRGSNHHARFDITARGDRVAVAMRSRDDRVRIAVSCRVTDRLPPTSVFRSAEEAARFQERTRVAYTSGGSPDRSEGCELRCSSWSLQPLEVEHLEVGLWEDLERIPADALRFDSALQAMGVPHEWHGLIPLSAARRSSDRVTARGTTPELQPAP